MCYMCIDMYWVHTWFLLQVWMHRAWKALCIQTFCEIKILMCVYTVFCRRWLMKVLTCGDSSISTDLPTATCALACCWALESRASAAHVRPLSILSLSCKMSHTGNSSLENILTLSKIWSLWLHFKTSVVYIKTIRSCCYLTLIGNQ